MPIESDGHSKDNPRLFELIENAPKTGKSPTVWAWPQLVDYLKIAGQPVAGPWPPHQEPRPDPDYESGPQAVADPHAQPSAPDIRGSRNDLRQRRKPSSSLRAEELNVPIAVPLRGAAFPG